MMIMRSFPYGRGRERERDDKCGLGVGGNNSTEEGRRMGLWETRAGVA